MLPTFQTVILVRYFYTSLKTKAFETEYIGQYKAQKAYSFFKSGWIGDIGSRKVVKCAVTPS